MWPWLTAAGEWNEEDHPRDEKGRFGPGDGSADQGRADQRSGFDALEAQQAPTAIPPISEPKARAQVVTDLCLKAAAEGHDTQHEHDMIDGEKGRYDADRDAIHQEIIGGILRDSIARGATAEREAIIMGGLPGAGKTTSLEGLADTSRFVTCNPDDMKAALAERGLIDAPPGLGAMEAGCLSHEESSDMAKDLAAQAQAQGLNVIWDVSMASAGGITSRLNELDANGYHTTAVFVDVPPQQAIDQAQTRYERQLADDPNMARPIPEGNIRGQVDPQGEYHSINRRVFEDVKTRFDQSVLIDNTGGAHRIAGVTGEGDPFGPDGKIRIGGRERVASAGPPVTTYAHFARRYRDQLDRRDEIEINLQARLARVFATQGRVVHRRLHAIRRQMATATPLTAAARHPVQPANPKVRHPVVQLRAEEVFMDGFDETLYDELEDPLTEDAADIGAALVGLGLFGTAAALNPAARNHVTAALRALSRTGRTAIGDVEDVLADTYQDGGDYDTMVSGVDSLFEGLVGARAAMMARQAATGLLGGMGTIAARLAGVPTQRMWVTQEDDRVRGTHPRDYYDHVEAHGQTVGLDEPFIVSGEELQYPGDPNGSLGNIINCRCYVVMVKPTDDQPDLGDGDLSDAEGDLTAAGEWTEGDHPRDDHGRFDSGGAEADHTDRLPQETITAWGQSLAEVAGNHDLHDPEGRADFRQAVEKATSGAKVDLIRQLATHYGGRVEGQSRAQAARALADAWIARGQYGRDEPLLSKVGVPREGSHSDRLTKEAEAIARRNLKEQSDERRAAREANHPHDKDPYRETTEFPGLHASGTPNEEDPMDQASLRSSLEKFAGNAGNAQSLIDWYNEGADGKIDWGQPGSFRDCVALAGDHVEDPEAFCAQRHYDATGHWPGEKKD